MNQISRMHVVVMALWGLVLPGCMASTGMARTLDQGRFQLSASPGLEGSLAIGPGGSNRVSPRIDVGVRYGLSDQVDMGAKLLSGAAAQADIRVGLVRAPSLQSGLDLTLAPSVLLGFAPATYQQYQTLEVSLPLLIGVNLGGGQLVLGPRASYRLYPWNTTPAIALVGTSLGVALPVGSSFHLVPEVTVLTSPGSPPELATSFAMVNVGVLWGGYKRE